MTFTTLSSSQWLAVPSPMIMPSDSRHFSAKLLLFGEHVLLLGATALAVPLTAFSGKWAWKKQQDPYFQKMMDFARSVALREIPGLDTDAFRQDLEAGMFFEANIPTGYGLGSSGAFCAAVYHRYVSKPETDLVALKKQLAAMECFFHGSSSGIDPLTSYLGLPVMIQHANQVTLATQKPWMNNQPVVFLVDSTLPRKSQTLIDWFLQSSQTESFQALLQEKYLPTHETLIQSWLEADADTFWPKIQAVSAFQREHFAPMVPATVQKIWEEGLATNQFTLKICGAGGGGFVLGFAKNQEALRTLLPTFRIHFPFSAG